MNKESRGLSLGDIAEVNPKVDGLSESDPFIPMAAVNASTKTVEYLEEVGARKGSRFKGGDTILARITPCLENGKVAQVPDDVHIGGGSTEFIVLRATDRVLPRYLFLLASSRAVRSQAEDLMVGTSGRKRVSATDIGRIRVQLPTLAEQQRIVDLTEAVERLADASGEIAVAAQYSVGLLRNELVWANNSPLIPLGDVTSIEASLVQPAGLTHLPHIGVDRIEKGTGRLVGVQTVEEDGVTSAKFRFAPDDIIYSKIRPNLQKVAAPGYDGLCSADAYPLRMADPTDRRYLYHLLLTTQFTEAAVAKSGRTKMPKINQKELFSIQVPWPDRETRAGHVEVLDSLQSVSDQASRYTQTIHTLRSELIADLLSGTHEIPDSYDELLSKAG